MQSQLEVCSSNQLGLSYVVGVGYILIGIQWNPLIQTPEMRTPH